ncbi:MAG: YheC/YheD family protein [Syntrophomonadaceae bacterium]|nr:YheC/YheD family protein [Syntrophomonadaceae bacterium]
MQTSGEIRVSQKLINRLGIPYSDTIKVRVGVRTVLARLEVREGTSAGYRISDGLIRALNLNSQSGLRLRYDRENEALHIGPLIGVLIDFLPNREEYDPKSIQAELIYLSTLGNKLPGQCFIFTPGGINWDSQTVTGYVWRHGGMERRRWSSARYPLPDVVYDRISTRRAQTRSKKIRLRLMNMPHLHYFNPSFLNKWRVHQLLAENPELHQYLPETHILNQNNLEVMAEMYKVLYIKPSNGSLGSRIIKTNVGKNKLHYTIYNHGRRSGQADNVAELLRATKITRGKRDYIVQQGIDLNTYHGSPFDLRIIIQKNGQGKWLISKKFARVAPRGSSIANLSRGGTAQTSRRVLSRIFQGNRPLIKSVNEELRHLCLTVAETLEASVQQTYGELGLDVGIDKRGHPWIIEVNSKPRKTTVTSWSKVIVRNTFQRPLQYAIYLAGFGKTR